jgi:hypothetical protein
MTLCGIPGAKLARLDGLARIPFTVLALQIPAADTDQGGPQGFPRKGRFGRAQLLDNPVNFSYEFLV